MGLRRPHDKEHTRPSNQKHSRWTEERFRAAIWQRLRDKLPLNPQALRNTGLLHAGLRLYGKWSTAIEKAGVTYDQVRVYRRWSKKKMITLIQERAKKGLVLSSKAVDSSDTGFRQAVNYYFPSWKAFLKAAGINLDTAFANRKWTRERVLREFAKLSPDIGYLELKKRDSGLLRAIYIHFGNLGNVRQYLRSRE